MEWISASIDEILKHGNLSVGYRIKKTPEVKALQSFYGPFTEDSDDFWCMIRHEAEQSFFDVYTAQCLHDTLLLRSLLSRWPILWMRFKSALGLTFKYSDELKENIALLRHYEKELTFTSEEFLEHHPIELLPAVLSVSPFLPVGTSVYQLDLSRLIDKKRLLIVEKEIAGWAIELSSIEYDEKHWQIEHVLDQEQRFRLNKKPTDHESPLATDTRELYFSSEEAAVAYAQSILNETIIVGSKEHAQNAEGSSLPKNYDGSTRTFQMPCLNSD